MEARSDPAQLRDALSVGAGRSLGDYPVLSPQITDGTNEGLRLALSLSGGEWQSHDGKYSALFTPPRVANHCLPPHIFPK